MARPHDWMKLATQALLWVFAMSWAFDFKADVAGDSQGGSLAQAAFLGLSVASGGAAMALNGRLLLTRPGVWLLLLWWGFLGYITLASLGQGVVPGHFVRILFPYLMIGLGIGVAQAAAGRGLTPMQIVTPMVLAGVVNVVWRIFYGFAFKGATLETARMEVFSPAMNPLFAYLGAALMLRPRFHWVNLLVAAITLGGVLISVTRALIFPMAVAGLLGAGCFGLGLLWRVFHTRQVPQKAAVFAGAALLGMVALAGVYAAVPLIIERWTERLFHKAGGGQTSADLSWLTREAEAKAMFDILRNDPLHFICGKGMGASYYWDASYWPELWTIYPADYDFSADIWFNGHSVWTYTIFSGGLIGLAFHLAFFGGTCLHGLAAVRAQARTGRAHDQTWLGFLPVFVVCCLLSESFTSNQLAERLTGVMLGLSAGLPQALYFARRPRPAPPLSPPIPAGGRPPLAPTAPIHAR